MHAWLSRGLIRADATQGKKKGRSKAAAAAFDLLDNDEAEADPPHENGDAPALPSEAPSELQNGHAGVPFVASASM